MTYEHEAEAINYTKEEYVGPARSFHWQACAPISRERAASRDKDKDL